MTHWSFCKCTNVSGLLPREIPFSGHTCGKYQIATTLMDTTYGLSATIQLIILTFRWVLRIPSIKITLLSKFWTIFWFINFQKLNLLQVNHGTVVVQEILCVCVHARAFVRAHAYVRGCVCAHAYVRGCVRACARFKALHGSSYKWIKEYEEYRCETP